MAEATKKRAPKHVHVWSVAYWSTVSDRKTTKMHCRLPDCDVPKGAFKDVEGHING